MGRGNTAGGARGNSIVQFYRWILGIGYERNVGGVERTVRYTGGALCLLAGVAVLAVPVLASGVLNAALAGLVLLAGLYTIYEARVQYCPLNHTLDRSTDAED